MLFFNRKTIWVIYFTFPKSQMLKEFGEGQCWKWEEISKGEIVRKVINFHRLGIVQLYIYIYAWSDPPEIPKSNHFYFHLKFAKLGIISLSSQFQFVFRRHFIICFYYFCALKWSDWVWILVDFERGFATLLDLGFWEWLVR